jgi:hypothetical protein
MLMHKPSSIKSINLSLVLSTILGKRSSLNCHLDEKFKWRCFRINLLNNGAFTNDNGTSSLTINNQVVVTQFVGFQKYLFFTNKGHKFAKFIHVKFSTIVVDVIWILKTKTELIHYIPMKLLWRILTHKKQKLTWSRSQREPVDEPEPKSQRWQTNECKPKPEKDQHMTNIHWAEWTTGSWVPVTFKTQGVSSHLVLEPALLS